ncbi:unnamed protein product, partial [Ectocarpus sp. 13 AM-2016]
MSSSASFTVMFFPVSFGAYTTPIHVKREGLWGSSPPYLLELPPLIDGRHLDRLWPVGVHLKRR